ncbi:MAG: flagellar basal body P-ring protein FlgI [Planctomycetota bacterium]
MPRFRATKTPNSAQFLPERRAGRAVEPQGQRSFTWWVALLLLVLLTARAGAVQIQDVARLRGAEGLPIIGVGLVTGLPGTGDAEIGPAHRMAREVILRLADDTTHLDDLDGVDSLALVMIHGRIPPNGAVSGDRVDVTVSTIDRSVSLEGGFLQIAIMHDPLPPQVGGGLEPGRPLPPGTGIYGLASGPIIIEGDEPGTVGRVRGGLHLTRDVTPNIFNAAGQVELVLNDANASWSVARNVAALINGLGPLGQDVEIATAVSPKSVVVAVPAPERRRPAGFLARILESFIDASQVTTGAKVRINQHTQTIVIDGNVEFTPTAISVRGLQIAAFRPPLPAEEIAPQPVVDRFVALDPNNRDERALLQDLVNDLNLLNVAFDDQANLIRELHRSGNLHAQLEDVH